MCENPSKYVMMQNTQSNRPAQGQVVTKNNQRNKKQTRPVSKDDNAANNTDKDFDFFNQETRPDSKFDI